MKKQISEGNKSGRVRWKKEEKKNESNEEILGQPEGGGGGNDVGMLCDTTEREIIFLLCEGTKRKGNN